MKYVHFVYIRFGSDARIQLEGIIKNILLKKYNFLCSVSYKSVCFRLGWGKFENGFVTPEIYREFNSFTHMYTRFSADTMSCLTLRQKQMCILKTKLDLWMQKRRDWSFLIIFIILFVSKVFNTEIILTSIFHDFPIVRFNPWYTNESS